ncbi:hypothetical protein LINPERPRIM_LOCUS8357 [Linum perenne]
MKGRKRSAASSSELAPEANDTAMRGKLVTGSYFDVQKAETSQQQLTAVPTLDMKQAELSRQHVRALNSQFSSWVQAQLKNHPDELWEDGVRDYLAHASHIMVLCLSYCYSFSVLCSYYELGMYLLSPWLFYHFLSHIRRSSTMPFFLSPADELPKPSSPSVKKAEEEGVVVVHEVKCKLYVKSIDGADKDTWKDKGPGKLSIKCTEGISKGTKESNPTIIVRNDVGKVLLNALLYQGIKMNLQKNAIVAIFHVAADESGSSESVAARTFLIRTKTVEDRDNLAAAIREYAPES